MFRGSACGSHPTPPPPPPPPPPQNELCRTIPHAIQLFPKSSIMSGLEKLVVDCIITCLIAYVVHEVMQRFASAIAA
jgi:hypothetical protein